MKRRKATVRVNQHDEYNIIIVEITVITIFLKKIIVSVIGVQAPFFVPKRYFLLLIIAGFLRLAQYVQLVCLYSCS